MVVEFLRSPFDGFEFDTHTKRMRLLESMSELGKDCATDHDRQMLLMAFDIVSHVELVTYE